MGDTPAGGSKEANERSAAQAVTTPEGSSGGRLDLVGRFARLARALEAAGLYNATKALRAGADRELTRVAAPAAQLRRGDGLTDMAPDAWQRPGRHPEWGPVTVLSQASYFARHQAAHQAQLAAAVEGRVPGEPRKPGS